MSESVESEQNEHAPWQVFRHLNADNATLYRVVLELFMEQKQSFVLHLKEIEILDRLRGRAGAVSMDALSVRAALTQLCGWGNLIARQDQSEARTLEDYRNQNFLYQLSAEGEAAEIALRHFRDHIEQPGELQATALRDIESALHEMSALLREEDFEKLHAAFTGLFTRFEQLARQAEKFMGGLQRAIELQDLDLDAVLAYKERLIDYLERFLSELTLRAPAIASLLLELDEAGMPAALRRLAERDLTDQLDTGPESRARQESKWRNRWQGMHTWFLGGKTPSQADNLRSFARGAIPELLSVLATLTERRNQRQDRAADYRTLARWFAECPDDEAAHTLWHNAFCLYPARFLTVDRATLDRYEELNQPARTSWLDAPGLEIAPSLRATGRSGGTGRSAGIPDHSAARHLLHERLAREAAQLREARRLLLAGDRQRLSDFAHLDPLAFDLLLDCLGEALARGGGQTAIQAQSADGTLHIHLAPIADAPIVHLPTNHGVFSGPDHSVRIEETRLEVSA